MFILGIKGLKALKKSHSFDPCFALPENTPSRKKVENEIAPTCITKTPWYVIYATERLVPWI